jgi:hypothetical protein
VSEFPFDENDNKRLLFYPFETRRRKKRKRMWRRRRGMWRKKRRRKESKWLCKLVLIRLHRARRGSTTP